jgi:hypothetical protein
MRDAFDTDEYQILLVANKFQTGFDQPLLCGMYVDKRLAGIQAVQTLSRLHSEHFGRPRHARVVGGGTGPKPSSRPWHDRTSEEAY